MKRKPLIILMVVLVVLVGLRWIQNSSHDASVKTSGLEEILPPLSLDQIGEITIAGPAGGEIVMSGTGGDWRVLSSYAHPAKVDKIEQLVGGLSGLSGEIRSRDGSVLADYGLDDGQGINLTLTDLTGNELGALVLGKIAGGSTMFVSLPGDHRAFAVRGNLLSSLGIYGEEREPQGRNFLDLKAVSLQRDDIDSIQLADGATRLELVKVFAAPVDTMPIDRTQYTWEAGGTELKSSAVNSLAGALTNIQAQGLLDPTLDHGFGASGKRAEIRLSDGGVTVVEFGAAVTEPKAGVAMRVFGDSSIYLVYDRLPERIFKTRSELLPDTEEG